MSASAFNSDATDPILKLDSIIDYVPSFLLNIFKARYSFSMGGAGMGAVGYNGEKWGIKAVARVYSPGYRTLNLPFFRATALKAY